MKHLIVSAAILLAASACFADENLLNNGDFSKGMVSWKGDFKVVDEGDGPVAAVSLDRRKPLELEQTVNVSDLSAVRVTLRYKTTPDFKGSSMSIGFAFRDRSAHYLIHQVKPGETWQTVSWTSNDLRGQKKATLRVEFKPGSGILYIDDVELVAK